MFSIRMSTFVGKIGASQDVTCSLKMQLKFWINFLEMYVINFFDKESVLTVCSTGSNLQIKLSKI